MNFVQVNAADGRVYLQPVLPQMSEGRTIGLPEVSTAGCHPSPTFELPGEVARLRVVAAEKCEAVEELEDELLAKRAEIAELEGELPGFAERAVREGPEWAAKMKSQRARIRELEDDAKDLELQVQPAARVAREALAAIDAAEREAIKAWLPELVLVVEHVKALRDRALEELARLDKRAGELVAEREAAATVGRVGSFRAGDASRAIELEHRVPMLEARPDPFAGALRQFNSGSDSPPSIGAVAAAERRARAIAERGVRRVDLDAVSASAGAEEA